MLIEVKIIKAPRPKDRPGISRSRKILLRGNPNIRFGAIHGWLMTSLRMIHVEEPF